MTQELSYLATLYILHKTVSTELKKSLGFTCRPVNVVLVLSDLPIGTSTGKSGKFNAVHFQTRQVRFPKNAVLETHGCIHF